jgi:hypothetical protein
MQSSGIYTLAFSMTPMDEGEGGRAANVRLLHPRSFQITTGRKPMSTAYPLALALGVAFATSAVAADVTTAKTKADCDKAGGMWDASTNTCKSKM